MFNVPYAVANVLVELHPPCRRKTLKLPSITLLFWKLVRCILIFIASLYLSGTCVAGKLEEALEMYKRSKQFGVERAAIHIRNVRVGLPVLTSMHEYFFTGQRKNFREKDEGSC